MNIKILKASGSKKKKKRLHFNLQTVFDLNSWYVEFELYDYSIWSKTCT